MGGRPDLAPDQQACALAAQGKDANLGERPGERPGATDRRAGLGPCESAAGAVGSVGQVHVDPVAQAHVGQVGPAAAGQPQRVHHSYVWLGAIKNVAVLAGVMALSVFGTVVSAADEIGELADVALRTGAHEPELFLVLLVPLLGALALMAAAIAAAVLVRWLSWRCLTYQLTAEEFSVRCGVISKKHFRVPCGRIQSVDVRASLFQRLAGVCSLEVNTAGGASNKAVVIPYLAKSAAVQLKADLFTRKHAGAAAVAAIAAPGASNVLDGMEAALSGARGLFDRASFAESDPVTFQAGLTNRELLLSGLSGVNGQASVIVFWLVGLCATFGLLDFAVDYAANALQDLFSTGVPVELVLRRLLPGMVAAMVGVCVLSFAATAVISAVSSLISYGGFMVRRRGSRVEVESGLLQRTTQGIDVERIQLLRVEHGWIRRRFGYCRVVLGRVDGVAGEQAGSSADLDQARGMVVHPFLKVDQLDTFLHGLLPEFADGYQLVHAGERGGAGAPAPASVAQAVADDAIGLVGVVDRATAAGDAPAPASVAGTATDGAVVAPVAASDAVGRAAAPASVAGTAACQGASVAGKQASAARTVEPADPTQAASAVQPALPASIAGRATAAGDATAATGTFALICAVPPANAKVRAVARHALWWNAGFWAVVVAVPTLAAAGTLFALDGPEDAAIFGMLIRCMLPLFLLPLAAVAVGAVRGLKWHAGSGARCSRDHALLVNEGLSRAEVLVPRQKIQFAELAANPFQRAAGLRTVRLATAAGQGRGAEELWDLALQDAAAVQEWYRPRA